MKIYEITILVLTSAFAVYYLLCSLLCWHSENTGDSERWRYIRRSLGLTALAVVEYFIFNSCV